MYRYKYVLYFSDDIRVSGREGGSGHGFPVGTKLDLAKSGNLTN